MPIRALVACPWKRLKKKPRAIGAGLTRLQNKIYLVDYVHIGRNHAFSSFSFLIFYFVSLVQYQPVESGGVNEDVPSGVIVGDESVTFGLIEKFNSSSHFKKIIK